METGRTRRTAKAPNRERKTLTVRCRPHTHARFMAAAGGRGHANEWAVKILLAAVDGRVETSIEELRTLFTYGRHLTRGDE